MTDSEKLHSELTHDLNGFQRGAIMHALVTLRVVDTLHPIPRTPEQLSRELDLDLSSLLRLLNAALSMRLIRVGPEGQYELTERGDLLRTSHPKSLAPYARLSLEQYWLPWRHITQSVRDGQTVFDRVHGSAPWEYRKLHPEQGALFDSWQKNESSYALRHIMEVWDLSSFKVVADIGGGIGTLLNACLTRWPQLRGILFEQAQTLEKMPSTSNADVAKRLQKLPGDFFKEIPVKADCWVLKSILHNWDDAHSLQILSRCAAAMSRHSSLFIIERVLRKELSPNAFMTDLHMLMVTGGKERSLAQYTELASRAGLAVNKMTPTAGDFSLIELVLE